MERNENPVVVISWIGNQFGQAPIRASVEQHVGNESPSVVVATVHDDVAHWLQVEWHMNCRLQRMIFSIDETFVDPIDVDNLRCGPSAPQSELSLLNGR